MIMICLSQKLGAEEQVPGKIRRLVSERSSSLVSSIWGCHTRQMPTLKWLAPLVDQAFINPFVYRCDHVPTAESAIWPGFDHPVINGMRSSRLEGSATIEPSVRGGPMPAVDYVMRHGSQTNPL